MKVHLAFNHRGINHETHAELWKRAIGMIGWESVELEKADLTIMWGCNYEFEVTRARGKPVLQLDFPYWNRGGKVRDGTEYYKVSLNGQHPTPYLMQEKHGPKRYKATNGPEIKPWREKGKHILIAGMGIKACDQYGYSVGEWEWRIAEKIQRQTNMEILYRGKPRQRAIPIIRGCTINNSDTPIENWIEGAHCLVCHHGNATVTALAMGVPIFMNGTIGVASHLASFDFDNIMQPVFPDNRQQFFNNLAHWQWSVSEIANGDVLRSYKNRGLI